MTREEKQKAINALKISTPIIAMRQERLNDYIQTLNKIIDWLEQEPTTKDDLGVDCIVDVLDSYTDLDIPYKHEIAENILAKLSSATRIRPKGHWYIDERPENNREVICSNCEQPVFKYHKLDFDYRPKYCPNCSAEMSEVEK